jgi:NAD(P)H-flavin reductase
MLNLSVGDSTDQEHEKYRIGVSPKGKIWRHTRRMESYRKRSNGILIGMSIPFLNGTLIPQTNRGLILIGLKD